MISPRKLLIGIALAVVVVAYASAYVVEVPKDENKDDKEFLQKIGIVGCYKNDECSGLPEVRLYLNIIIIMILS